MAKVQISEKQIGAVQKHENEPCSLHILQFHIFCGGFRGIASVQLPSPKKNWDHLHKSLTVGSTKAQRNVSCFHDTWTGQRFHWTNHCTSGAKTSPLTCTMSDGKVCQLWTEFYNKCADVLFPRVEYNVHSYSFTAVSLRWFDIREICMWSEAGWNKNNPLVKQLLSFFLE